MDYIVLITGDPYYFWQIDLLIESFRYHNLEHKLVIGVRSDTNQVFLPPNATDHKRKFIFSTQSHKYEPINKIYGIYAALMAKHITQPFVMLHPDMILMQPFPEVTENVTFHITPDDHIEAVEKPPSLPWICIDGVAAFRDIPINFFIKAFLNAQQMCEDVSLEKLGKAAWAKTMYQFRELFSYRGMSLELELGHHNYQAPLIHYRKGMLPYFSKSHYRHYGVMQTADDPFAVLVENNTTSTTDFLRNIALLYLQNRK